MYFTMFLSKNHDEGDDDDKTEVIT